MDRRQEIEKLAESCLTAGRGPFPPFPLASQSKVSPQMIAGKGGFMREGDSPEGMLLRSARDVSAGEDGAGRRKQRAKRNFFPPELQSERGKGKERKRKRGQIFPSGRVFLRREKGRKTNEKLAKGTFFFSFLPARKGAPRAMHAFLSLSILSLSE